MRPGQRVGPYVVRKVLGSGAMGLVLEVEHPELGNEYALKVVRPDVLGDSDSVKRFQREMEALAQVDGHPGIVRIHSAGLTDEGAPYYAMELIRGQSMRDAMKRGLPEEGALDALEQVGRALAHLHTRGLIHRDVKPENVLIGDDGQARLTDFGLARWLGLQPERVTRTGDLVGTPTHMAPEQALRSLGEVGPWTDVYGLGVMLYEVFTGTTPYTGRTAIEVYTKVAEGAPFDPPGRARPDLDPALEAVCLRALARRPTDRFTDVPSFLTALARARASGDDAGPRRRGPGLLLGIAGASLVVGGLALGAAWWRSDQQRRARDEDTRALAAEVAELERALGRGALDAAYGDGRALLAAERARASGPRGPVDALARVVDDAARRRALAAYREGDVARAKALLDESPGLALDERAFILALAGEPARALEALPASARPVERAQVAAWAGDALACAAALAKVEPPDRARALGWELAVSASLPALLPAADDAVGAGPASTWGLVARGEAALAQGLVPLAAIAFDEALLQASDRSDAELEVAATLGLCQVALARGDLEAASARVAHAHRRCDGSVSPLTRARVLGWAACVAVASGGTTPELHSVLGGRDALDAATRAAPGAPLVAAARGGARHLGPAAWPALRDARAAGAAADLAGATAAYSRVGVEPGATLGTLIGRERAACARGHDGAPGLLLARAADLAAAAEAGNDRAAAAEALALLEVARRLRPTSPLAWAATSQAARVRRDLAAALEAARQARDLAPGCAWARLEEARALALSVEADGLLLDLQRVEGTPAPAEERRLAERLDRVAQAHREARGARATDDAITDAARLGAARAIVEAAWRRGCDDPASRVDALDPLVAALDEELRPLLARVDVAALTEARAALAEAVLTTEPGAQDGAVADAERALARAAWGESTRALDLAALEALLLRAAPMDDDVHARAFLALAGDLPARALLWARRAERATDDAVARHQRLAHAAALAPDLPHVALEQELEGRGRSAASLLRLARVVARAPELARAVIDMLALAPRTPEDERALWEELGRADAPPRERHRARALLLRGTRAFSPAPDASAPASERAAHEREVKARTAWHDDASRRAYAEATRALVSDGQDALAGVDAGTRVLRALCASSLARGAGPGAACDPRALPDALFDARVARAAAPWASAPLLVQLDLGSTELAGEAADELLVHGFLTGAAERLFRSQRGEAVARRMQPYAHLLAELDLRRAARTFDIARVMQEGGVAPRLTLALRLQPIVDDSDDADELGDDSFSALLRHALAERADVTAGASATYWFARAEHEDDGAAAQARALEAALRAAHEGHAGGLGLALQPRQVLAPGVRREAPLVEPADTAVFARNLPSQAALGDVWSGLSRPERALPLLAQLRADLAEEPESEDVVVEAEDLLAPWSKVRAHLLDLQGPHQSWAVEWWADGGEPGDLLLAVDRAVAFRRHVPTEEVAYWLILWQLRWNVVGDPGDDPVLRRTYAVMARAAALRLREVVPSAALRGLAADSALDVAFLEAPPGGPDPDALARAHAEAEAAAPDLVPPNLESGAASWWRLARARAVAGKIPEALDALARVKGRIAAHDHWGLEWVLTAHDPALPALKAVPEVAAFVDEWLRENGGE